MAPARASAAGGAIGDRAQARVRAPVEIAAMWAQWCGGAVTSLPFLKQGPLTPSPPIAAPGVEEAEHDVEGAHEGRDLGRVADHLRRPTTGG